MENGQKYEDTRLNTPTGHLSVSASGFLSDSAYWPAAGRHIVERTNEHQRLLGFYSEEDLYLSNACADFQLPLLGRL